MNDAVNMLCISDNLLKNSQCLFDFKKLIKKEVVNNHHKTSNF